MGSSKYRSSSEIVLLVLKSCIKPMKKTHISYCANLNSFQLAKYLRMLMDNGLLALTEDNKLVTTHKGLLLVERLEKVFELLSDPESNNSLISNIKSALKGLAEDVGYELHENYTIRGKSGVLHVFNFVLNLRPPIVVVIGSSTSNGIEDTCKVLSFIVQVIDVEGYGVYITTSRLSRSLIAMLNRMLKDDVQRRVKVISGSTSIEALKEDLYTALSEMPLTAR